MTTPSRVAVILNPVSSRSGRAVQEIRAACASAGLATPLVLGTTVEEPGPTQVGEALARGCDRIVVVGGDGTARLVAGALADLGAGSARGVRRVGDEPPSGMRSPATLGVVPVGTANLFARSARLPVGDLRAAARLAVLGEGRPTDLGEVEVRGARHPFLVVAGIGHDADTVAAVRPSAKGRLRWLAYFVPGLRRLWRPGYRLSLTKDGDPLEVGPLWSLLAVNAARLPAGAQVVPGARLDDGVLHVALVSPRGLLGWVRVAGTGLGPRRSRGRAAADGRYPRDHRALAYRGARELVVEAPEPVLAQVDGDVVRDVRTARISVRPGAVTIARS